MAIVMGLDQHRAQITADWLDTEAGEVSRRRISPAHRAGVRAFCEQLCGQQLEVALEATTGWRFAAEEFRRIGAAVHLAEPAETAARRGNKKRAKSDRADARHVRELLMLGRLPESWIPSDHILDLRARVRLRHTLSHQRGEWQQRIQAVLYHHGCPQRSNLMQGRGDDGAGAARTEQGQPLPPAREGGSPTQTGKWHVAERKRGRAVSDQVPVDDRCDRSWRGRAVFEIVWSVTSLAGGVTTPRNPCGPLLGVLDG